MKAKKGPGFIAVTDFRIAAILLFLLQACTSSQLSTIKESQKNYPILLDQGKEHHYYRAKAFESLMSLRKACNSPVKKNREKEVIRDLCSLYDFPAEMARFDSFRSPTDDRIYLFYHQRASLQDLGAQLPDHSRVCFYWYNAGDAVRVIEFAVQIYSESASSDFSHDFVISERQVDSNHAFYQGSSPVCSKNVPMPAMLISKSRVRVNVQRLERDSSLN